MYLTIQLNNNVKHAPVCTCTHKHRNTHAGYISLQPANETTKQLPAWLEVYKYNLIFQLKFLTNGLQSQADESQRDRKDVNKNF